MPIDYGRLKPKSAGDRPTDPLKLFKSLRLRDDGINDLWDGQGQALRQWNDARKNKDVAIALNTGAGKTLIGLLIAQSLVNEVASDVLYACSSLQLVAQTAEKAEGYGLQVTTYVSGDKYSNDLFERGLAPCITTYHALFNGKSRFAHQAPAAVIFDDAHAAGHIIRQHFTLEITRHERAAAYMSLCDAFKPYFEAIGDSVSYREIVDQRAAGTKFVPPFVVHESNDLITDIVLASKPAETRSTLFAWAYLRDKLNLCAVMVTARSIVFTPPFIPVGTLPYFEREVRRVYLSATLAADDSFYRSFGRLPEVVISPDTPAGECERMILFPARVPGVADIRAATKSAIGSNKVLVLVPTSYRRSHWDEISTVQADDSATRQVEEFKRAKPPAGLVLTARYDGVDLPGDTCRIMAMDGVPTGIGALEDYLWRQLQLNRALNSTVATRITQSFGRISRGMSDYGVVFIADESLTRWLSGPRNLKALPAFLRKQVRLGYEFSSQLTKPEDLSTARQDCLSRREGWIDHYSAAMEADDDDEPSPADDVAILMARTEAVAAQFIWLRDYKAAIKIFEDTLHTIYSDTARGGAWHELWLGYMYLLLGDQSTASSLFARAHRAARNIPPPRPVAAIVAEDLNPQIKNVRDLLLGECAAGAMRLPLKFDMETKHLTYESSPAQVEESLRALGAYLGLDSYRPEKEYGTGPDVLWLANNIALCLDAKSGKKEAGCYQKEELGQLYDHVQWVKDNEPALVKILPGFAGRLLPACERANPADDVIVLRLENLAALRDRLRAALRDVCASAVPLDVHIRAEEIFSERRLLWPDVLDSLDPIQVSRA